MNALMLSHSIKACRNVVISSRFVGAVRDFSSIQLVQTQTLRIMIMHMQAYIGE